jgi:hypothetical protein
VKVLLHNEGSDSHLQETHRLVTRRGVHAYVHAPPRS